MEYKQIIVTNSKKDDTIYTYLKSLGKSENYIVNLRKSKENIKLNNVFAFTNVKVKDNDILEVNENPNTKTSLLPIDIPLDIVFEDENMLIVNKPSSLCSMPNKIHYENNLAGAIINYIHKKDKNFVLRILNRLDKDTQGIIVIAKNAFVYADLFKSIKKVYHALVSGRIEKPFEINSPIETLTGENGKNIMKRIISKNGKNATTKVKPIKVFENATLVEITLIQGRTHQIRVHLSSVGHALFGDELYGKKSDLISHTALVCKQISLVNPTTKQLMTFEVDYESEFCNLLKKF